MASPSQSPREICLRRPGTTAAQSVQFGASAALWPPKYTYGMDRLPVTHDEQIAIALCLLGGSEVNHYLARVLQRSEVHTRSAACINAKCRPKTAVNKANSILSTTSASVNLING